MRILATVVLSSLMLFGGATAGAQGISPAAAGPPAAAPPAQKSPTEAQFPPADQMPPVPRWPEPMSAAPEGGGDETYDSHGQAYPGDDGYAANIDYDVAYDDSVAQSYDDGYDPQAYRQFEQTLAPYGSWVDDPSYGRVWVPSSAVVGDDFSPYATNGDWMSTEYGWTWVSGWDWGWAPFHYGRWALGANNGWCWVPGTLWGPGWVGWRAGGGFVGWAPLPPRRLTVGSPLGPHSAWRFTMAGDLGRAHQPYLSPQIVPRIFTRMNVVSNPRMLLAGRTPVRVNAGPTRTGGQLVGNPPGGGPLVGSPPAPAHLATVAPQALPRFSIPARSGTPITSRPWVHAGVVSLGPTSASMYASRGGSFSTAQGSRAGGAGFVGRPPGQGQPGALGYRAGSRPAGAVFGSAGRSAYGPPAGYRGPPVYRAAPQFAPRGAGGYSGPRYSAPPSFSRSPAPAFRGGGGGRSFGGGGGGRSFGGGGGRRR